MYELQQLKTRARFLWDCLCIYLNSKLIHVQFYSKMV